MAKTQNITIEEIVPSDIEEVKEIIFNPSGFSVFEDYKDFQVLVIRRMLLKEALSFTSEAFIITEKGIYYCDLGGENFKPLKNGIEDMLQLLERFYNRNQSIITRYGGEVSKLEDFLFDRDIPSYFMDMWFDLKRDLAHVENFYYRNATVYKEFYKKAEKHFRGLEDEFKDIDESIQFHTSNISTLKGRLDSLHNYYDSIKSDRLNKTLLSLTIISGVFLPLNLIVGFFGMNTQGLYFTNDPNGTQRVLVILVGVVLVCLLGIKVIRLVDHYILRFILGRYNFYKTLTNKIDKIDERLKGQ